MKTPALDSLQRYDEKETGGTYCRRWEITATADGDYVRFDDVKVAVAKDFEAAEKIRLEVMGHLGAALAQSIDKDDQIIMQHVRDAYVLLGGKQWHHSPLEYQGPAQHRDGCMCVDCKLAGLEAKADADEATKVSHIMAATKALYRKGDVGQLRRQIEEEQERARVERALGRLNTDLLRQDAEDE